MLWSGGEACICLRALIAPQGTLCTQHMCLLMPAPCLSALQQSSMNRERTSAPKWDTTGQGSIWDEILKS